MVEAREPWTLLCKRKIIGTKDATLCAMTQNLIPGRNYRILCDGVLIAQFGGDQKEENIFVESTGEMQIFDFFTDGSEDRGEGDSFNVLSYRR